MSNLTAGDRVRLKSNVFNLPANLAGTVIGNGPIPNSFQILLDDGTENCWYATITVTVPDGDYCNRDLKCAYLWVSYDDDERNSRCNLKHQDVFREAPDSALIKKMLGVSDGMREGGVRGMTDMAISKMETTTQKGREKMTTKELNDVLGKHKKWIKGEEGGVRANLSGANLRYADLAGADLSGADLWTANLERADLSTADLSGADLIRADLSDANLLRANLRAADLRAADLRDAYLDFSCWPLWCGSLDVKVDKRIVAQLAYHFCRLDCDDPEYQEAREALSKLANQFHRVDECGRIEDHV